MCKKYRPSNGTEGDIFMDHYCTHCIHEKFWHTQMHGDLQCDILSATMLYNTNDPEYPEEWTYNDNGYPVCTKYQHWDWRNGDGGWNEPPEIIPIGPNQLVLFVLEELGISQNDTHLHHLTTQ